jgi:outer membrane lipopolysaccharide assembly protein LptE/RlpB
MISLWQFATGFAAIAPELALWLNKKKTMPIVRDLYGAPEDAIVSEEEFEVNLDQWRQQQAQQMQMQAAAVAADAAAKGASANQQNAQAEATRAGMNGLTNGGGAGNPMEMVL